MRRRAAAALFLAALLTLSCTDGVLQDPATPDDGSPDEAATATLAVLPSFTSSVPPTAPAAPINRLIARVRDADTDEVRATVTRDVDPQGPWTLEIAVSLPPSGRAEVFLEMELVSVDGDRTVVVWSGRSPVMSVRAKETQSVQRVELAPGPLANREVRSLKIQGAPETLLVDGSAELEAVLAPPVDGAKPIWASLDEDVLAVDANGVVSALAPGTGRIVATAGDASDRVEIEVLGRIAELTVDPPEAVVHSLGGEVSFQAVALDADGERVEDPELEWEALDPSVARRTDRGPGPGPVGRFVARNEGTTTIRVSWARDPDVRAEATLRVEQKAATIEVTPEERTVRRVGTPAVFNARVLDADGSPIPGAEPTWSVTNPEVAEIDGSGRATTLATGTTEVVATVGEAEGRATLTVLGGIERVVVTPGAATLRSVGATAKFSARVVGPGGDDVPDEPVEWSSTDGSVVTVNDEGLATAVDAGEAEVVATAGEVSGRATVRVMLREGPTVVSVRVSPSSATITGIGQTTKFAAEGLDEDGEPVSGARFHWTVENAEVASVNGSGVARAAAVGETTVRATLESVRGVDVSAEDAPSGEATLTVEADGGGGGGGGDGGGGSVASVEVSPSSATLTRVGAKQKLSATVLDDQGSSVPNPAVSWTSSDTSVATVSSNGLVTAVADGTATVTATVDGVSGSATITVDTGG